MTLVTPYAHVPFGRRVYTPSWGPLVSHDVPFADGISGSVSFTITAETPLLVGGLRRKATQSSSGNVLPFRLETRTGARYVIPPSSLQGMIRSVLETVSFARMGRFVDDKRFGIRDLSGGAKKIYVNRLNTITSNRGIHEVRPRVRAGWLRGIEFETAQGGTGLPTVCEFRPCEMARIDYSELTTIMPSVAWTTPGDAGKRYSLSGVSSLCQKLFVDDQAVGRSHGPRNPKLPGNPKSLIINYRQSYFSSRAATTCKNGNIVLTGMVAPPKNPRPNSASPKHMEFFFFDEKDACSFKCDSRHKEDQKFFRVFREFYSIHEPDDGRKANPTWLMMTGRGGLGMPSGYPCCPSFDPSGRATHFLDGGWMPIFYIAGKGQDGCEDPYNILSFGLAYMFKLAHENTARELVRNSHAEHLPEKEHHLDLPSLIFGLEASEGDGPRSDGLAHAGKGKGLKRRAWFDFAIEPNISTPRPDRTRNGETCVKNAVLLSPKPQFFPIYVRQPGGGHALSGGDYATYTPLTPERNEGREAPHVEVRSPEAAGIKVWPAIAAQGYQTPAQIGSGSDAMRSDLTACDAGMQFSGVLHFHNLRPMELGALLWALTFGDPSDQPRHRLGMAKAYGWGQIRLKLTQKRFAWCAPDYAPKDRQQLGVADLIVAFTKHMDNWCARELSQPEGPARVWSDTAQVKGVLEAATPRAAKPAFRLVGAFPANAERVIGYPTDKGYAAYKNVKDGKRVQPPMTGGGWEFGRSSRD